ncbi:MAG: hypothetical protein JHC93_08685 [Parachlamydiales bacterium]|nr:hypothetical protein [Parachlamydiales bacterium]
MENEFRLVVSSNSDYEKMVIYLDFNRDLWAILNCDEGNDQIKIEILDKNEDKISWKMDLEALILALNNAKKKLIEVNKGL